MSDRLTIETLYLEIPENPSARNFIEAKMTVKVSPDLIKKAMDLSKAKVEAKYPNVIISPDMRICLSHRTGEKQLTASCEMCIGDGDYVSRVVMLDLPEIKFQLTSEYRDNDAKP